MCIIWDFPKVKTTKRNEFFSYQELNLRPCHPSLTTLPLIQILAFVFLSNNWYKYIFWKLGPCSVALIAWAKNCFWWPTQMTILPIMEGRVGVNFMLHPNHRHPPRLFSTIDLSSYLLDIFKLIIRIHVALLIFLFNLHTIIWALSYWSIHRWKLKTNRRNMKRVWIPTLVVERVGNGSGYPTNRGQAV